MNKPLYYKIGDEVTYTAHPMAAPLGLSTAKFDNKKAIVTDASHDRFGWPRYSLDFGNDSLVLVHDSRINSNLVLKDIELTENFSF